MRTKNPLNKNPNIAYLETSYQLSFSLKSFSNQAFITPVYRHSEGGKGAHGPHRRKGEGLGRQCDVWTHGEVEFGEIRGGGHQTETAAFDVTR